MQDAIAKLVASIMLFWSLANAWMAPRADCQTRTLNIESFFVSPACARVLLRWVPLVSEELVAFVSLESNWVLRTEYIEGPLT